MFGNKVHSRLKKDGSIDDEDTQADLKADNFLAIAKSFFSLLYTMHLSY